MKKRCTKLINPDDDWDQDWRAEWQEARRKLDFYPEVTLRKVVPEGSKPKRPIGRPKKEIEPLLTRFCFHCQKIKEGGAIMQLNLLSDEICIRPVFICIRCQKKISLSAINGIK